MAEVYWRALSRDVPYTEFASRPITQAAAGNLARMSGYQGPDPASSLFRDNTPGDLTGPAISQFLWQTIPFGSSPLPQRWQALRHETEYLTGFDEWLAVANGATRFAPAAYCEQARYIATRAISPRMSGRTFRIRRSSTPVSSSSAGAEPSLPL